MKKFIILLFIGTSLFAEWDNAYGHGTDILKPNEKIDYEKEFHKSIEKRMPYDESMKNSMIPVVEVEERMEKTEEKNNYDQNTQNFYYSTNKRDYYKKEMKKYKKFPTTDF